MRMRSLTVIGSLMAFCLSAATAQTQNAMPLRLIKTFNLSGDVTGRFDHFAADPQHSRLFVVPKDAKAVMVLDLGSGKVIHTIDHLGEPQGVLYRADLDNIYIADGARGTVEIIDGKTYLPRKSIKLRLNADSIAYDPVSRYLYVVNGGVDAKMKHSFISIIDTSLGKTVGEIEVDGDTLEAMALEKATSIMYVDNRAKNQVEVIDRKTYGIVATWPVTLGKTLVAMALDEASHRLFVGGRDGSIVIFDTVTGKEMQALSIGPGLDDLVFDTASKRLYAACGGSGTIDVYEEADRDHYRSLGKVPSGPLARSGLLISDLKQYFVAVPKSTNKSATILVYEVQ
jgi:DNA-binding beta-propeller fold protein YncE